MSKLKKVKIARRRPSDRILELEEQLDTERRTKAYENRKRAEDEQRSFLSAFCDGIELVTAPDDAFYALSYLGDRRVVQHTNIHLGALRRIVSIIRFEHL